MTFYLSKTLWSLFNPFHLILIIFFIGFILNLISFKLISKIFYIFSFLLLFIFGVLPTGSYLNFLLEKNFHSSNYYPDSLDGILILAGATKPNLTKEHNQINLNGLVERLTESIFLINKYPEARVIFSGGSGSLSNNTLTHASVAKQFFEKVGIKPERILYEDKSRNTYENILFSKEIAKPNINQKWLLVTSAFHLKRSLNIAEKLEWNFIPYATDFNKSKKFSWKISFNILSNLSEFQRASHEWLGLISYYFLGRSASII